MKKEDLEEVSKAQDIVTKAIYKSDIEPLMKMELMVNLNLFLHPELYRHNIEILEKDLIKHKQVLDGTIKKK